MRACVSSCKRVCVRVCMHVCMYTPYTINTVVTQWKSIFKFRQTYVILLYTNVMDFVYVGGETYVTFRSGTTGTAPGFIAVVNNNITLHRCNWGRFVDMKVPKTTGCALRSSSKRSLPCVS